MGQDRNEICSLRRQQLSVKMKETDFGGDFVMLIKGLHRPFLFGVSPELSKENFLPPIHLFKIWNRFEIEIL